MEFSAGTPRERRGNLWQEALTASDFFVLQISLT